MYSSGYASCDVKKELDSNMDSAKVKDFTSQRNSEDTYTVFKINKSDIKTSDHKPPFVVSMTGSDYSYSLIKIPKVIKTRAELEKELESGVTVYKNLDTSAKQKIIDQQIKSEVSNLNLVKTEFKRINSDIDSLLEKYGVVSSSSISKEWDTNYRIKACAFFYILQFIYFLMFDDGSRGAAAIWEYILGIFAGNTLLGISIIALHTNVFPNSAYVLSLWILCCLVIFWSMYKIPSVRDDPTLNKNTKAELNDMYLYSWYELFVSVEVFYVSAVLGVILNNAPQPTEKKK